MSWVRALFMTFGTISLFYKKIITLLIYFFAGYLHLHLLKRFDLHFSRSTKYPFPIPPDNLFENVLKLERPRTIKTHLSKTNQSERCKGTQNSLWCLKLWILNTIFYIETMILLPIYSQGCFTKNYTWTADNPTDG